MKNNDVQIGALYRAKVSGNTATVRIDSEASGRGWWATNVATKRRVRILTAQRLRRRVDAGTKGDDQMATKTKTKTSTKASKATKRTKKAASAEQKLLDKAKAGKLSDQEVDAYVAGDGTAKKTRKAKTATAKTAKPDKPKRTSALDAAYEILSTTGQPMNAKDLVAAMAERGLWTSPGGKTPHATLYAAMLREINAKGPNARFTKVDRGQFAANAAAA